MKIGLLTAEEAAVRDSEAGYHAFTNEDGEQYGSFNVFWHDEDKSAYSADIDDEQTMSSGWYWRAEFPGCVPEGDAEGPFASSYKARLAADEHWTG